MQGNTGKKVDARDACYCIACALVSNLHHRQSSKLKVQKENLTSAFDFGRVV
jgi:hypothetical protein